MLSLGLLVVLGGATWLPAAALALIAPPARYPAAQPAVAAKAFAH
ncbi:hypothetical protein [Pseudoruegeria sp. HB172150]|nr:hypothetical protein [Pseudoruegeria sp. HB172150]